MANNAHERVVVLDFGGQYAQLIARRVRDLGVYCEIKSYKTNPEELRDCKGILFTGGPNSVYAQDAPLCSKEVFELGIPVLGICYGAQVMAYLLGGTVSSSEVPEFGKTMTQFKSDSPLFQNVGESVCWMSHNDYISQLPEGFTASAWSAHCPAAAMENVERKLYATQFHPEVEHTRLRAARCSATSCTTSAAAPATGRMRILCPGDHRPPSGSGWGIRRSSAACPAAWIPLWRPCWCTRPSART